MSTDYLTKDAIIPTNQNFCCMSLFMDDNKKTIKYIKVSGAFNTVEEAQEQVQLVKEPGHYNFVAEMGSWNAFDPLPNKGNLNDQLNAIMERYLISMHKKNYDYEQRKYELIIKNLAENISVKTTELTSASDEMATKIKLQMKELQVKKDEYQTKLDNINDKLKNVVIESKYVVPQLDESDNFNQNVPIKFTGKINRTEERVINQEYYCISFLTESHIESNTTQTIVGIKVSGCFDTEESANNHSSALRDINESFNIHVGKLYEWCPFNPDPESVEAGESEYANTQLNDTMKKKKENEQKAKLYHEFRKNELIRKNLEDLIHNKKQETEEKNKLLLNIKNETTKDSMVSQLADLDEQIKTLETKFKEYEVKEKELASKLDLVSGPNVVEPTSAQDSLSV